MANEDVALRSGLTGYTTTIFSEVGDRDGLGMELYDAADERLAEVFRADDRDGHLTFAAFTQDSIPLPVLMWFLARAADDLTSRARTRGPTEGA